MELSPTILFAHVLHYYFARVYLSLAVKRRSRHHLPNGQVASANFVFNFIKHPHCPHTLIGLINSGHSRQILNRSLETFLGTLGEPSMRFQGRTSPESSDILVFYTMLGSVSRRTYHPWSRAVLMAWQLAHRTSHLAISILRVARPTLRRTASVTLNLFSDGLI